MTKYIIFSYQLILHELFYEMNVIVFAEFACQGAIGLHEATL